jgi:hypothetical protein
MLINIFLKVLKTTLQLVAQSAVQRLATAALRSTDMHGCGCGR